MEGAQTRVQREAERVFENLDKELIRKIQVNEIKLSFNYELLFMHFFTWQVRIKRQISNVISFRDMVS